MKWDKRERERGGGVLEINLCDLQDLTTNWGKILEVWEYDFVINDNWEIRRKLLSGEENNYIYPHILSAAF